MTDIVLGAIIAGVSVLAGSVIGYVIQGHYSLKNKREDNLIRKEELLTRIQHEKNRDLISRIIEARARYLSPLSDQLGELNTSVNDFTDKLLSVIVTYLPFLHEGSEVLGASEIIKEIETRKDVEIQVEAAKKQEFIMKLKTVETELKAIGTLRTRIYEAAIKAKDVKLREFLRDIVEKVYSMQQAYYSMKLDLEKSTTGHDFIYDIEAILKPARDVNVCTAHTNHHIESLLAGADAGDE